MEVIGRYQPLIETD